MFEENICKKNQVPRQENGKRSWKDVYRRFAFKGLQKGQIHEGMPEK